MIYFSFILLSLIGMGLLLFPTIFYCLNVLHITLLHTVGLLFSGAIFYLLTDICIRFGLAGLIGMLYTAKLKNLGVDENKRD